MLHTVIFIGRSGSGKGTQAELLKNYLREKDEKKRQILYIETGAHFRNFIRLDNYSSNLSREAYEKDERQPDFLATYMWSTMLVEELGEDMHLFFDGAPRSKAEAILLSTALDFYKRGGATVIYINVGTRWAEERLLARGRSDDKTIAKITKRLNWFDEDTWPAVEYFRDNSYYRFIEIDGEQSIDQVHRDIIEQYGS